MVMTFNFRYFNQMCSESDQNQIMIRTGYGQLGSIRTRIRSTWEYSEPDTVNLGVFGPGYGQLGSIRTRIRSTWECSDPDSVNLKVFGSETMPLTLIKPFTSPTLIQYVQEVMTHFI